MDALRTGDVSWLRWVADFGSTDVAYLALRNPDDTNKASPNLVVLWRNEAVETGSDGETCCV